jgi:hypothetical protein
MLKKIILKADLLTINKDVLQTSFIDMMVYPSLGLVFPEEFLLK